MKTYVFNAHNVCTNPDRTVDWSNKACRFVIETAQSPNGRWNSGIDCTVHHSSRGFGVLLCRNMSSGYPSQRHATAAAIEECLKFAREELRELSTRPDDHEGNSPPNVTIIPYIRTAISQLDTYLECFTPNQLF